MVLAGNSWQDLSSSSLETLGKGCHVSLAGDSWSKHLASLFPETLSKGFATRSAHCRVLPPRNSAKFWATWHTLDRRCVVESVARGTWQRCRLVASPVTDRSVCSITLPSARFTALGKGFRTCLPSACENELGKVFFADQWPAESGSPSVVLGKPFAERFLAFAECLWHSANLEIPVVHNGKPEDVE